MEIDIAAETKKMQKEVRKVGDKSGVGCTSKDKKADRGTEREAQKGHGKPSIKDLMD
eukprot:CAMPEP_0185599652 /NCGR_PEP_ID=MMETSP0434-20130131/82852_1 /TAXON_ID=626734 ORGANISM="Favella taraikaensis, Strain Fe Narragansett Bay" /NCGR_SAMPLE_ID=MMETSP0434 /ASSEMBLY_ACC=CAM_ASM_000379 /LENGTH=56 /DNA_ID=CAMNT_0028229129 /DNA_START=603 /DNA_END=773 /DNA_ORIENTATION=-